MKNLFKKTKRTQEMSLKEIKEKRPEVYYHMTAKNGLNVVIDNQYDKYTNYYKNI